MKKPVLKMKHSSRLALKRGFLGALVALGFILPWQACGPAATPNGSSTASSSLGSGQMGNGDVYTGMRSLTTLARSAYNPAIPYTPAPNEYYYRFIKGQQCTAGSSSPQNAGAIRFFENSWRLTQNACSKSEDPISDVLQTVYDPNVLSWQGQIFGRSERRDDLFTSSYTWMWCRSDSTTDEGIDVTIGQKLIDATQAGDGSFTMQFPPDRAVLPAGVTFSRVDANAVATYTAADRTIATAPPGDPRIDYDPMTGKNLGLLVEDTRTNFAVNSSEIQFWNKSSSAVIVGNQTLAPDGKLAAEQAYANAGNAYIEQSLPGANGTNPTYTFSIFVQAGGTKPVTLSYVSDTKNLSAQFDIQKQKVLSKSNETYTAIAAYPGWVRLQFTFPHQAANARVRAEFSHTASEKLYFWGAQLEAGSYASSYIATSTSPVTRKADFVSIENRKLFDLNQGSLVVRFTPYENQNEGALLELRDASGSRAWTGAIESPQKQFAMTLSSSGSTLSSVSFGSVRGFPDLRVGLNLSSAKLTGALSGALRIDDAETMIKSRFSKLLIGRSESGRAALSGHLLQIIYWEKVLSDGTLVHETGSGQPLPLQGQISVGAYDSVNRSHYRDSVFNFQVAKKSISASSSQYSAPDYDFNLVVAGSPDPIKHEVAAQLEVAIDQRLYKTSVKCIVESANAR